MNEALKAMVSLVRHKPGLINQDYHVFSYVNQLKHTGPLFLIS